VKHTTTVSLFLSLLLSILLPTSNVNAEVPPLPIRKVVLYSSGVGYFEHIGSVSGTVETTLQFKTEQINDILKSLVLEDLGGGKIGAVVYPSRDPVAKTLQSFQVDLANDPALPELLAQLRGTQVSILAGVDLTEGTILGVEKRLKALSTESVPVEVPVVNVLSGATVKSVYLDQITSLEIRDGALQAELAKALETLAQSRDQNKKPVTLHFNGQGERQVRFGYLVETPVWKTSYRLVLPKDATGEAFLQGWAIIENQTDHDWSGIDLSLVSGRPISFIQDLYQPLYVPRPTVQPELYTSLTPEKYAGGSYDVGRGMAGAAKAGGAQGGYGAFGYAGREIKEQVAGDQVDSLDFAAVPGAPAAPPAPVPVAPKSVGVQTQPPVPPGEHFYAEAVTASPINPVASVASAASAGKIGELFQYTVGEVTLPRQRSAMIPIVTDPIKAERLSIYNRNTLATNPLLGARLINTTGKHLLQGPMTVFDEGAYAGDSQIDNLPPDQNRLLSYAIDLKARVNSNTTHDDSQVVSGKIVKGVLEISNKNVSSRDYVIANLDTKAKTFVVEHPIRGGWELVDTPKPVEKTDAVYRFALSVPAGATQTLVVKEQRVGFQSISILPLNIEQMVSYMGFGEISEPVRAAIGKAVEMRRSMTEIERSIAEKTAKVQEITTEQERIRANMASSIDTKSQYYTRLLTKLNEQETLIEGLQKEIVTLQEKLEGQRKELEDYLAQLDIG